MTETNTRSYGLSLLLVFFLTPGSVRGQMADPTSVATTGNPTHDSLTAGRTAAVHETSRGVFIDPLVTEHAYVDRKVRSDFRARLLRDDEGEVFENTFIFEYAFTRWFSLELAQSLLACAITGPCQARSRQRGRRKPG